MSITQTGTVRVVFEGDERDIERAVRSSQAALGRMDSSTRKYGTTVRKADDDTDRFNRRTSALGNTLKGAAGAAVGAAAAYVGISQITTAITATQDLAKATGSLVANLGMGTKDASAWAAVAATRGVDSAKLGMSFKTLATQVVAARDGTESSIASFKKLGISQKEIQKGSKDTTFMVGEVADGLANLEGGADKATISGKLFGKGWQDVQPILRDGSDEMQNQLDLANKYGASFGGKTLDSFKDLREAQLKLKMAQLGLQVQFTKHIAPALIDVGLAFAKFIKQLSNGKGFGGDVAREFDRIADNVNVAYKVVKWVVNAIKDAFEFLKQGVKDSVRHILDIWHAIDGPIKAVVKVVGGVLRGFGRGVASIARGIIGRFRAIGGVVKDVVRWIVNAVGDAIEALGDLKDELPEVNLPSLPGEDIEPEDITGGGGIFGARGGTVPGQGIGDKVPAMLEPKEFIVNSRAASRHRPLLEKINNDPARFGAVQTHSIPFTVGRQGGGMARYRRQERHLERRVRRLSRDETPGKGRASEIAHLQVVIDQLHSAIQEQNANLRQLRSVRRAQRDVLDEVIAAAVSGVIGGQVGRATQAAGVPGSFGRL